MSNSLRTIARKRATRAFDLLFSWLDGRRARFSPRVKRALWLAAAGLFAGATILAYQRLPQVEHPVRWGLVVLVALLGASAGMLLNGAEYALSARLLAYRVPFFEAVRVGILASAANQLPVPGSALVRMRALRKLDSGYRRAASSTALVGLAWIAATGIVVGMLQIPGGPRGLGVAFLLAGLVTLGVVHVGLRALVGPDGSGRLLVKIAFVEAASILVTGFRLYGIILALGFKVSVPQAIALAASAVVGSAVGFFPGGLGIRELLAAAISPLVGLAASLAVIATAVDRVLTMAALGLVMVLTVRRWFPSSSKGLDKESSEEISGRGRTANRVEPHGPGRSPAVSPGGVSVDSDGPA